MMEPAYQFIGERLEAGLRASVTTFTEHDLAETWEALVQDGSDEVYVLSSERLSVTIAALAEVGSGPDPRVISRHVEARRRLDSHDGCEDVLQELIAQRDDAVSALLTAREYCRNDTYEGKYGDRYLTIDRVLDALRPTVPGRGTYSRLNYPDYCDACQSMFGHEDDCWAEAERGHLETRRVHAIKSHLHCLDMGNSLTGQIHRCMVRIEAIAKQIRIYETYAEDDGMVIRYDDVISAFQLDDLNITFDEQQPASIAAARHQVVDSG